MQANHPLVHVVGRVPTWQAGLTASDAQRLRLLMAKISAHAKARYSKKWGAEADGLMAQYHALELEAFRRASATKEPA